MKNRGMSGVVITVILVALSLVAVGIVWTFIQTLVDQNTEQAQLSSDCIKVTPRILNIEDTTPDEGDDGSSYNITVGLPIQSEDPDGLRVSLGGSSEDVTVSPGENAVAEFTNVDSNVKKVEVTAFFNINDQDELCPGSVSKRI